MIGATLKMPSTAFRRHGDMKRRSASRPPLRQQKPLPTRKTAVADFFAYGRAPIRQLPLFTYLMLPIPARHFPMPLADQQASRWRVIALTECHFPATSNAGQPRAPISRFHWPRRACCRNVPLSRVPPLISAARRACRYFLSYHRHKMTTRGVRLIIITKCTTMFEQQKIGKNTIDDGSTT